MIWLDDNSWILFGDLNDIKMLFSCFFVFIVMLDCDEGMRKGGKMESKVRRKR